MLGLESVRSFDTSDWEIYSNEYDEWWPAKDYDGFERLRINTNGVLEVYDAEYNEWRCGNELLVRKSMNKSESRT